MVAMPECGWMPKRGPSAVAGLSKKSRNTNGLIRSPSPDGLTTRVMGPWRRPWVRAAMRRVSISRGSLAIRLALDDGAAKALYYYGIHVPNRSMIEALY